MKMANEYSSNKEGYNKIFPNDIKEGLSFALFLASSQMKILFQNKCSVFHHKERYLEFSKELESILLSGKNIYFEGGSVQANLNNLLPHLDTENCSAEGYNYSSVLSTKVHGTRVSWIGYNRKRAYNYMLIMAKAQEAKRLSELIG